MNIKTQIKNQTKIQQVEMEIYRAKNQVVIGIEKAIKRGDILQDVEEKSQHLSNQANMFHKQAKKTRWEMWKRKCKGNILFIVITVIIIIVIIAIIVGFS